MIVLEPCFDFPPSLLKIQQVSSLIGQGYQFTKAELLRRMPDHFGSVGMGVPASDLDSALSGKTEEALG